MFSFPDFLSVYLCAQEHVAQGQSFGMISMQSIESSNQVVNSTCAHTRLPETYFLMSFVNCTGETTLRTKQSFEGSTNDTIDFLR